MGASCLPDEKAQRFDLALEYHLCNKMKNLFEKIAMRGMGAYLQAVERGGLRHVVPESRLHSGPHQHAGIGPQGL
jgi:hypothetical protein